ncbi:MAG: toxin-antitoxin system HicB family antitoxin [Acidimicrobiia bacterium]|nr:toxin-antitoxin system HicB family antitoxin [Acidimicrobiia bacterium]
MDTRSVMAGLEASLNAQLELAATDPAVESAARALMLALDPAIKQAAFEIAQQAALEVDAQLPDASVEVTLRDGEPTLVVRQEEGDAARYRSDELAARLTVRLPEALKAELEAAADDVGDSVNAYVIKSLSSQGRKRSRKRIQGTFET